MHTGDVFTSVVSTMADKPEESKPKKTKLDYDHFLLDKLFPDVETAFSVRPPRLEVLQQKCVFALDTNALLAPYELGAGEAGDIVEVYRRLSSENKLFVPARAAQEFARNKLIVLKRMYDSVYNWTSHLGKVESLDKLRCPMLQGRSAYAEFINASKAMTEARKTYSQSLTKLMDDLKDWSWDDPISLLYAELFKADRICSQDVKRDLVLERLEYHNVHKVPPGYKDGGKADEGIGDLLIWLSLLKLAKTRKSNVIFVCNEEKTDWVERTQNTVLAVRAELTHEFHAQTGFHFGLVSFAKFLAIAGAKQETIEQAETLKPDDESQPIDVDPLFDLILKLRQVIQSHDAMSERRMSGFNFRKLEILTQELGVTFRAFFNELRDSAGASLTIRILKKLEEIIDVAGDVASVPQLSPSMTGKATMLTERCNEFMGLSADWIAWYRTMPPL